MTSNIWARAGGVQQSGRMEGGWGEGQEAAAQCKWKWMGEIRRYLRYITLFSLSPLAEFKKSK